MKTTKKAGRPPSGKTPRDTQCVFYLTKPDSDFLEDCASQLGFRSKSQLVTAIMERLIIGGFSGVSFVKLGFQFSNLPAVRNHLFFGVRPFPPLIGEKDDPDDEELSPYIDRLQKALP